MRWKKIAQVTVGLMATGAVVGGMAGGLVTLLWSATTGWFERGILMFGIVGGALLGTVLGPPTAWLLLRHVPLGRAVLLPTLGTLVGGALAVLLSSADTPFSVMVGGFAGFGVATLATSFLTPRKALPAGGGARPRISGESGG